MSFVFLCGVISIYVPEPEFLEVQDTKIILNNTFRIYSFMFTHEKVMFTLNYILKWHININEPHVHGTKEIYLKRYSPLEFRLRKIKDAEDFYIAEINNREKMRI